LLTQSRRAIVSVSWLREIMRMMIRIHSNGRRRCDMVGQVVVGCSSEMWWRERKEKRGVNRVNRAILYRWAIFPGGTRRDKIDGLCGGHGAPYFAPRGSGSSECSGCPFFLLLFNSRIADER
jgi:hypothetical protein